MCHLQLMMSLNCALITGGAGFLGSHLAEKLVAAGSRVLCVDNFLSGSSRNIAHLRDTGNFELISHDICLPLQVETDEIYNFAGLVSPVFENQKQKGMAETSVLGTLNMLKLARQMNCKILQASSSEVYQLPIPAPNIDDGWARNYQIRYLPTYAASKRYAEALFQKYALEYGIGIKIARIFDTYGPRMPASDGNIVAAFIDQALRGKDLLIQGDGKRLHSLCYVDDVIDACILLMDRPDAVTGPVDIAAAEEISTLALAKMIIALTGSASKIVTKRAPRERKPDLPDTEQAERLLGWKATTRLQAGLMRTIEYFDFHYSLAAIGADS